ncbi:CHAT domain-containing protein [Oceanicola sp. 502str15]|uniref:CHAT domain-containing tetratricopeptide repeat protein n=1 Tax=Oceanicola sp. 502str15 TaxID=2696061 RepID=UPI0020948E5B|nr:CHAT domain-containing protein [Oceanicola sp. 502str15]MCO6382211.1 CHAT domain-containing protein [Oceanicola sp. 502str15]
MRAAAVLLTAALLALVSLVPPAGAQPVESPAAWDALWGNMIAAEARGDFPAALAMADRLLPAAEAGWGAGSEQALEARAMRARLLSGVGDYGAARQEGQRAYEGFLAVLGPGHRRTQTEAMTFAVRLSEVGEPERAVPLALEAIAMAEAHLPADDPQLNLWRYNLGGFLQDLGRLAEADAIYGRAAEALARAPGSAQAALYRATVMAQWARLGDEMGQGEAAAARGREAIALAQDRLGPIHPETLRTMRDQALRLYHAGGILEAHDLIEVALARTIETYGTRNLTYAQTLHLRALLRSRSPTGSALFASAIDDQRAVVALLREILPPNHPELGRALLDLAPMLRDAGAPLEALETALAAEQARAPSRKLLIGMLDNALTHGVISGERATREMFRVAQGFLASRAGIAFEQSAYRKALGEGGGEYRALTDRQRREGQLHAALAEIAGRPLAQRDPVQEAALRGAISENTAEIARLEQALSGQLPAMSDLLGSAVLEIEEVQALLGPREALVVMDYSPRPGDPHVIHAITREQAIYVPIHVEAEALAAAVADLRGSIDLRLGVRAATALKAPEGAGAGPKPFHLPASAWLYRMSFAAIEPALADKSHLFVLQRGAMASLPPHLLSRNAPERLEEADWLVRHVSITVIPSVAALRGGRTGTGGAGGEAPILGFSNPDFAGALLALPETTGELHSVARALGGGAEGLRDGAGASEAAAKSADLALYKTLYFATHGLVAGDVVGGQRLDEPALALTGGGGEDGLLKASEIAALTLDADLVVLSACNTAQGDGAGGEALSGLAQAFTYAGARGLLVSHWPVESQSAVALMTDIFARRAANPAMPAAEAQRQSMLAMIDGPNPDWHHPAFWAPFILVGDPDR